MSSSSSDESGCGGCGIIILGIIALYALSYILRMIVFVFINITAAGIYAGRMGLYFMLEGLARIWFYISNTWAMLISKLGYLDYMSAVFIEIDPIIGWAIWGAIIGAGIGFIHAVNGLRRSYTVPKIIIFVGIIIILVVISYISLINANIITNMPSFL